MFISARNVALLSRTAAPPPLDAIATQPLFAYGATRLRSAYSGPAMRVVRPSDSATLDIGFSGRGIDTAALDTFLGSEVGQVDVWYDQSGNGNDAPQTTAASRPTIESSSIAGGPVTINGIRPLVLTNGYMAIPVGVTANRNAVNWFGVVEERYRTQSALIQMGSGSTQFTLFEQGASNGLWASGMPNLSKPAQHRACLFEVSGNGTTGTVAQDLESSTGTISAASMAGGYLGNTSTTGGYTSVSYMAAQIAFGSVLSAADRTALRAGMRATFGVYPAAVTGRVVFIGDSITATSSPAAAYGYGFAKMAQRTLPSGIAAYNYGNSGSQLQNVLPTYATNGAGVILQQYSDTRVVLLFYGTNDLTIGGRTAAQIYADLQTYCGNVHTDGGKVAVATLLPNKAWNSTQQTTRTDLNTLIRTNWASFADALCDFGAEPTMGPQAAASDTTLYPDGLHPSRLGHTYLAPLATAAINALL